MHVINSQKVVPGTGVTPDGDIACFIACAIVCIITQLAMSQTGFIFAAA